MKTPTCEELANMTMVEILEMAIANEMESFTYYKTAADCVGDVKIKELLLSLAHLEEAHKLKLEAHLIELKAHMEFHDAISLRYEKS